MKFSIKLNKNIQAKTDNAVKALFESVAKLNKIAIEAEEQIVDNRNEMIALQTENDSLNAGILRNNRIANKIKDLLS